MTCRSTSYQSVALMSTCIDVDSSATAIIEMHMPSNESQKASDMIYVRKRLEES